MAYNNSLMPVKSITSLQLLGAAAYVGCATLAFAQSDQKLSAREIFYAPAAAAEAKAANGKPADSKPAKPAQRPKAPAPAPSTEIAHDSNVPSRQQVTLATMTRKPLGIRLSILKIAQDGQTEVAPETTFKPGDKVRLSIQVSESGYLYIINRGSSATWTQLFPSPDLPNANNAVMPGVTYSVPPDRNFVVSDPPGEEKLFIILSRNPELDVDSLTMDMSRRESSDKQKEAPARRLPTTMAANLPPMNDAMVDRLRNAYSRDLIIEKVDEQTPGTRKENAVYAINPSGADDSRVVLDARIKHR